MNSCSMEIQWSNTKNKNSILENGAAISGRTDMAERNMEIIPIESILRIQEAVVTKFSCVLSESQEDDVCRCTLSTLALVLADVSTYWTPHSSAFPRASSTDTCRRSSRSDLFPTSRRGILSSSAFTRRICSL